jgi:hypothetical protein
MRSLLFIIIAVFVGLPSVAFADDVVVPANRTSVISGFWVFGKQNCHHPGRLKNSVGRKPQHGKIVVKFEKRRIPKEVSGTCAGRMSGVMLIYYTPDRGYRGKDAATVNFRFPQYQGGYGNDIGRSMRFSLTVK